MVSVFHWKHSSVSSKLICKPKDFLLMFCQVHSFAFFLRDLEQTANLVTVLKFHLHWEFIVGFSQLLEWYSGLLLIFSNSDNQMQGARSWATDSARLEEAWETHTEFGRWGRGDIYKGKRNVLIPSGRSVKVFVLYNIQFFIWWCLFKKFCRNKKPWYKTVILDLWSQKKFFFLE